MNALFRFIKEKVLLHSYLLYVDETLIQGEVLSPPYHITPQLSTRRFPSHIISTRMKRAFILGYNY